MHGERGAYIPLDGCRMEGGINASDAIPRNQATSATDTLVFFLTAVGLLGCALVELLAAMPRLHACTAIQSSFSMRAIMQSWLV